MVDKPIKDKVKTYLIDINIKYKFTGTENDLERLKNDKDYLKNVCNALILNKNESSDESLGTSDISVTAVNLCNAKDVCNTQAIITTQEPLVSKPLEEASVNLCNAKDVCNTQGIINTPEPQVSKAVELLGTDTASCKTVTSETTSQTNVSSVLTDATSESDNVKQIIQAASQATPNTIKPQQNSPTNNVTKLRPIAMKLTPPTIYGQTGNSSQQFVPIILKPVNNSFTLVTQGQVMPTVDTSKKPTPCNQPITPKTSKFISSQKSFLSDLHPFRPVKPNELLLDFYESYLNMFAESKHSRAGIWEKIAVKMAEQGYPVTGTQCNNRWRYLLATFNKVATTEGQTNSFKYFNRIAEILYKKSTLPGNINKTKEGLGETMIEVIGDEQESEERVPVKKRRKQKDYEKDEMLAQLSKKMEKLQEMQNEMSTFLSSFKDNVVKKE